MSIAIDLSPRTWQDWWLARPKWLRIGCWAALAVLLSHLLIVLRLMVGQRVERDIQAIRQRGGQVQYFWSPVITAQTMWPAHERWPGYEWFQGGLWGRNRQYVTEVTLSQATDADLRNLCAQFPNLQSLMLTETEVTSSGLAELAKLHDLRCLYIHDSDIGDEEALAIATIPTLALVSLNETKVTDAVIPSLQQMKLLRTVGLAFTDVSPEAIAAWNATRKWAIQSEILGRIPEDLYGSFRWSDGRRHDRFLGPAVIEIEGPLGTEPLQKMSKTVPSVEDNQYLLVYHHLHWTAAELAKFSDGDYRFKLKLGDYDAEPVIIHIENGKPSVQQFEFQMPVTRKQALGETP